MNENSAKIYSLLMAVFVVMLVLTNIIGTNNLLSVAEKNQVERVVCLSTDKAVYPINTMGMSKALMEKLAVSKARDSRVKNIDAVYKNTFAKVVKKGVKVLCYNCKLTPLGIKVNKPIKIL